MGPGGLPFPLDFGDLSTLLLSGRPSSTLHISPSECLCLFLILTTSSTSSILRLSILSTPTDGSGSGKTTSSADTFSKTFTRGSKSDILTLDSNLSRLLTILFSKKADRKLKFLVYKIKKQVIFPTFLGIQKFRVTWTT